MSSSSQGSFALKYRPKNFKQIIGHEDVVTRLKGLVSSDKVPNAIFLSGPPSVGKTTLARCFAAELNGVRSFSELGPDYLEQNFADRGNIEDVRSLEKTSKFKPRHKYRVIVLDEAHGVLRNGTAANAFLKPLEEPSPQTVWVLCSMSPEAFSNTTTGRALLSRCTHFKLEAPSEADMTKLARRILKNEDMLSYARPLIPDLVSASNFEMRTLSNLIQGLQQYYEGLEKKPKQLKTEDISSVVRSSTESAGDDALAIDVLMAVYTSSFIEAQRSLLDVKEPFMFINKLVNMNQFLMNSTILKGAKHRKVWFTTSNKALLQRAKKGKINLATIAEANAHLIETKGMVQASTVPADELISARVYRLIQSLKGV